MASEPPQRRATDGRARQTWQRAVTAPLRGAHADPDSRSSIGPRERPARATGRRTDSGPGWTISSTPGGDGAPAELGLGGGGGARRRSRIGARRTARRPGGEPSGRGERGGGAAAALGLGGGGGARRRWRIGARRTARRLEDDPSDRDELAGRLNGDR